MELFLQEWQYGSDLYGLWFKTLRGYHNSQGFQIVLATHRSRGIPWGCGGCSLRLATAAFGVLISLILMDVLLVLKTCISFFIFSLQLCCYSVVYSAWVSFYWPSSALTGVHQSSSHLVSMPLSRKIVNHFVWPCMDLRSPGSCNFWHFGYLLGIWGIIFIFCVFSGCCGLPPTHHYLLPDSDNPILL